MIKHSRRRRGFAALFAVLMAFTFTACQSGGEDRPQGAGQKTETGNNAAEGAKGRYVEQAVSETDGFIMAMQLLEDGSVRIVTDHGVSDSKDQGKTWEAWTGIPSEMKADMEGESHLGQAAISPAGEILYQTSDDLSSGSAKFVKSDGSVQQVALKGDSGKEFPIEAIQFAPSGDILCMSKGRVHQLDAKTLTVKHIYGEEAAPSAEGIAAQPNFIAVGEKLYMMESDMEIAGDGSVKTTDVNITIYDLNNNQEEKGPDVLRDFLMETPSLPGKIAGPDGKTLYLASTNGIFRFQTEGSALEKLFAGEQGQMFNPSLFIDGGIAFEDGSLLLSYYGGNYEGAALFRYVYDPEAPVQASETLVVYSLYESSLIRQAISAFQSSNQNVQVTYEVGMTGSDAVTRTDALKTLNTNIMAGEGPDILFLDGMPVQSYAKKGLLEDLIEVVEEVQKSGGLFDNIIRAYQEGDQIPAVPACFAVPALMGNQHSLREARTLDQLASLMEEARRQKPEAKQLLGNYPSSSILMSLMPASSPAWWKEDGTLSREKLTEFLEAVSRIAKAQGGDNEEGQMEWPENEALDLTPFMSNLELYTLEMGYAGADFTFGNLEKGMDLCYVLSAGKRLGGGYQEIPGQAEHVFVPKGAVGISAKSANPEAAKQFIQFYLTEGQSLAGIDEWPVNEEAFDQKMELPSFMKDRLGVQTMTSELGESFQMEVVWPSEAEISEFKDVVKGLRVPAITDETINRTVLEEGKKCLLGKTTVSEAVDAILDKVNLYLSE